jgi:protein-S-isoprenylcysteine O-methyltransferase Ste14
MSFLTLASCFWVVFVVYWLIASRNRKKEVYRQPLFARTVISASFLLGAALLFLRRLSVSWLGLRLLPQNSITGVLGTLVSAGGLVFALWARQTLGANWSGVVTLREEHELIRLGPYRLVRHPIYTGVLLLVLGTAIVLGEVRGFLAAVFFIGSIALRIRDEEKLLTQHFPQAYPEYQKQTPALIPWLF